MDCHRIFLLRDQPSQGYKKVPYGIAVPAGVKKLNVAAKLRFRQADQQIAEKLLAAVPKDIDIEEIYGLKAVPSLPVVDMVVKETSVAASK